VFRRSGGDNVGVTTRTRRIAVLAAAIGTLCGVAGMALLALSGHAGRPDALHLVTVGIATILSGSALVRLRPQLPYGPSCWPMAWYSG